MAGFSIAVSSGILLFSISDKISAAVRDKRAQGYDKKPHPSSPSFYRRLQIPDSPTTRFIRYYLWQTTWRILK
jgi:hypothetical protein